jgi:hypothetical protein
MQKAHFWGYLLNTNTMEGSIAWKWTKTTAIDMSY